MDYVRFAFVVSSDYDVGKFIDSSGLGGALQDSRSRLASLGQLPPELPFVSALDPDTVGPALLP
eukprot:9991408-Lingulodinium_polyedra.AAC.1